MSIETIERAITKLEQLKQDAAPLPWSIENHEESKWREPHQMVAQINAPDGEPAIMQLGCSCCDFGLAGQPETFELVAALSRTVDPLLAFLHYSAANSILSTAAVNLVDPNALLLARAILGETEQ